MHFFWVNPLSTDLPSGLLSSMACCTIPHFRSMISPVIHLYLICSLSVFSHIMIYDVPIFSHDFPIVSFVFFSQLRPVPRGRASTSGHARDARPLGGTNRCCEDPSSQGKLTTSNSTPAVFFKKASKNRLWSSLMADLFVDLGTILWKRGWAAIKCTPAACRAYQT